MKKVILTIVTAVALFSCSPEDSVGVDLLVGDWMEYNLTNYYYNQPERGEEVYTFSTPDVWHIDNYYEDGVLIPDIYTIGIGGQFLNIGRNVGNTFSILGEPSLIEIIVEGEFMTFEDISSESTGSPRVIRKFIRL